MAKQSTFSFTNDTVGEVTIPTYTLGLTTNYALVDEDANNAVLSNKTAPIDAEELVTFRSRKIASVNTALNVQNPAKVQNGIQYQAQVEAILVTTDTDDPTFRVDDPMVATLTIRHYRSGNIQESAVITLVKRLLSSIVKEDGTWRLADLMRGAERPIAD